MTNSTGSIVSDANPSSDNNAVSDNNSAEFNLHQELLALHENLRKTMRAQWNRALPLNELLTDRWGRASELGFEDGASLYDASYVFGDVKVGEKTWIGPYTVLDGSGGLTIGRYCSISAGVHIYTHESLFWALTGGKAEYQKSPVYIGDNCYIGSQAIIRMGVSIGNRCVIGAGAFVNRDIPENSIAVGAPARVIGSVVDDGLGGVSLHYHEKQNC